MTQIFFIDTFTSELFKGNPTSICYSTEPICDSVMLGLAKEFNLPVTAFVMETDDKFLIRYFTRLAEIPACGHATLAAAAVIAAIRSQSTVYFQTAAGASIHTKLIDGFVSMSYPRHQIKSFKPGKLLLRALGINNYNACGICKELDTLFIELQSPEQLKKISPDFEALIAASSVIKEVVITVADSGHYDYLLRSFCPWIGINEDPVTGSVQAALAPYWSARLGKTNLHAYQTSSRGGDLFLSVENGGVSILGKCVLVMKGKLLLS